MRILLVTFSMYNSFQDAVVSMCEKLKTSDEVFTLTQANSDFIFSRYENNFFIDGPKNPGIDLKTFNIFEIHRMLKLIIKLQIDIIYFESIHLWNLIIMLRFKKISVISSIHDVIPHEDGFKRKKIQLLYHLIIRRSNKILLRNKKDKELFLDLYKCKEDKVDIIPLWISYPEFNESTNGRIALFFGRLNDYKGVNQLPEIARRCPEINFIVAGKADSGIDETLKSLNELPNVRVEEGFVDSSKICEYYKYANWVILPYKTATQSGIVVDAYKYSRPVIAYEVGAISEQVVNYRTGFLVEPSNLESFIECLEKAVCLTDKEYRELCYSAFTFGKKQFSVDAVKKQFLKSIQVSK